MFVHIYRECVFRHYSHIFGVKCSQAAVCTIYILCSQKVLRMLSETQLHGWGKSIAETVSHIKVRKLFTYWLVVVFQAHHSSTQARKTIMGTNTVMVDKVLQKAWTSNITLMVISHNVNFPMLHTCPLLVIHKTIGWTIFKKLITRTRLILTECLEVQ